MFACSEAFSHLQIESKRNVANSIVTMAPFRMDRLHCTKLARGRILLKEGNLFSFLLMLGQILTFKAW